MSTESVRAGGDGKFYEAFHPNMEEFENSLVPLLIRWLWALNSLSSPLIQAFYVLQLGLLLRLHVTKFGLENIVYNQRVHLPWGWHLFVPIESLSVSWRRRKALMDSVCLALLASLSLLTAPLSLRPSSLRIKRLISFLSLMHAWAAGFVGS